MSQLQILEADPRDYEEIRQLWQDHIGPQYATPIEELLANRSQFLKAELDGKIIGGAYTYRLAAQPDDDESHLYPCDWLYLYAIAVDPEYHGRGIGTLLLRALADTAPDWAHGFVADIDSDGTLPKWYAQRGFYVAKVVMCPSPTSGYAVARDWTRSTVREHELSVRGRINHIRRALRGNLPDDFQEREARVDFRALVEREQDICAPMDEPGWSLVAEDADPANGTIICDHLRIAPAQARTMFAHDEKHSLMCLMCLIYGMPEGYADLVETMACDGCAITSSEVITKSYPHRDSGTFVVIRLCPSCRRGESIDPVKSPRRIAESFFSNVSMDEMRDLRDKLRSGELTELMELLRSKGIEP